MATRPSQQGRKNRVLSTRHSNKKDDYHLATKVEKGHQMTLTRKLMLCAELVGMEACVNFQQIYTVPALQTLGMPLSLTYLPGLVAGPSAIFVLPVLGWLVERGNNPRCRRIASLVFGACIQGLGMLCLLLANAFHMGYLLNYNATTAIGTTPSTLPNNTVFLDLDPGLNVGEFGLIESMLNEDFNNVSVDDSRDMLPVGDDSPLMEDGDSANVPFKALLGLLGFILMDLGFDCSNCFVKAFLVCCSPREEQTSLIVLGVMIGAVGGVINAVLGLVDFTSLLGLGDIDGAKLTIQTSVQGILIVLIVFLGLLTTTITGLKQLRQLHQIKPETASTKIHEKRRRRKSSKFHKNSIESTRFQENSTTSYFDNLVSSPENRRKRSLADAFETSIQSFGGSGIYMDRSVNLMEEVAPSLAEAAPLLENEILDENDMDGDRITPHPNGYSAVESADFSHEKTSFAKMPDGDCAGLGSEKSRGGWLSCLQNPKVRIGFVCLTTFFSAEALVTVSYTVSDFVGKAVYEGDPMGEPGSDSLSRYQEGMKTASWALLVYFITYFVCSLVHGKVLAVLGFRVEFPLLQMLSVVMMVVVGFAKRMEAVYVLSVVAAMHRTCHYTMPFAVTNEIAQDIVSTGTGRSPVALAMSLVAASIPLSYCVLFTWVGAVEQLTGDVSAPLWLGSAAGVLAVVAFLFVGKV